MTPNATAVETRPMFVMFGPSAVIPPSAKNSACAVITIVTHSAPTHGPTRIAASAPPSR